MTVELRVSAQNEEDMLSFLRFCGAVQNAGSKGSCESFEVVVDGDGSGRYSFAINTETGWQMVPSCEVKSPLWLGE